MRCACFSRPREGCLLFGSKYKGCNTQTHFVVKQIEVLCDFHMFLSWVGSFGGGGLIRFLIGCSIKIVFCGAGRAVTY